ncbi:MAG TPA: GGDEF domain-containing protein, partial [Nannocystaceae bacterium]|nr:GGDEF domain-containing protein [Nannocystaceae bacterium]
MSDGPKLSRSHAPRLALAGKEPPGPPLGASLVVIVGEGLGRRFDLEWGTTTIGRSETNGICLRENGIARIHAAIVRDDQGVVIRDRGSCGGTFVEGRRIRELALQGGERIAVGRTILKFFLGDELDRAYHDELQRLSTLDGPTQVVHRRYFVEVLARELREAREHDDPLGVIVLDVDHFAQCNDTFGPRAGDDVLRRLADAMRGRAREHDVVARWGGDELALLLPRTALADAVALAQTIRAAVEDTRFVVDERRVPVTISLGVAALDAADPDADALVGRALAALER